jgi:hypothetical protein
MVSCRLCNPSEYAWWDAGGAGVYFPPTREFALEGGVPAFGQLVGEDGVVI